MVMVMLRDQHFHQDPLEDWQLGWYGILIKSVLHGCFEVDLFESGENQGQKYDNQYYCRKIIQLPVLDLQKCPYVNNTVEDR